MSFLILCFVGCLMYSYPCFSDPVELIQSACGLFLAFLGAILFICQAVKGGK